MPEQLKFDLNPTEKSKEISEIYEWLQKIVNDTAPLADYIILGNFLICPNCDAKYIEESWCECWYWLQVEEKIDLDELDFLEVIDNKKAKYKIIWTIKFQIPNKKHKNILLPENRELKVDLNNLLIWENNAIIYISIKKYKYRLECFYETIEQLDENHRSDPEKSKIIHNLKLKIFDISKELEESFDFKQDILKQLKFLITIEILNNYKYNKNL